MYKNQLFINNEFRDALSGASIPTVNPYTGEVICEVSEAGPEDVDAAVAAASSAQAAWIKIDPSDRATLLWKMAEEIEEHGEELAQLDSVDAGRPISDAREDIHAAVKNFRYFAGLTDKIHGTTIPAQNDKFVYTRREPYGVVGAITSWNYPLFNASAKLAPVLAAGNSCIIKPAEETPLTTLRLCEIISAVDGVPAGLINVLCGPGETTGELIVRHPGIAKVTFTGSTGTGRSLLAASAASNLKGLTLELGGKAPVLVFADADLDVAAKAIAFSAFYNQGQTCTAATRIIVDQSVSEALLSRVIAIAERLAAGDPSDESTTLGPLVSKAQYEKVAGYLERAKTRGEHLVLGGYDALTPKGFFVAPTIFDEVSPSSEIFTDEIFGPVLGFTSFGSEDEAVELANQSSYGLAAGVWTKDVARMHRVASAIRVGIVWGNTLFSEHPGAPAGGVGQSGYGREFGLGAIEEYTQSKTVWVDLSGEYFDWV